MTGVIAVAEALAEYTGEAAINSIRIAIGPIKFVRSSKDEGGTWGEFEGIDDGIGTISFYAGATKWTTLVAHELGHAFNKRVEVNGGTTPYKTLFDDGIWVGERQIAGYRKGYTVPGTGFTCNGKQCYDDKGEAIDANHYWREYAGTSFHHSEYQTRNEDFADTFANWATNNFTNDDAGKARQDFMTTNMSEWVTAASGK